MHLSEQRSTRLSLKMYVTTTSVVHATVERRVYIHTQKAWKGSQTKKRKARVCEHLSNVEARAKERVEVEAEAEAKDEEKEEEEEDTTPMPRPDIGRRRLRRRKTERRG